MPLEETQFFARNMTISPMGGIRIACFVKNGAGVPQPKRTLPHFTLVYITRGSGTYWDETGIITNVNVGDTILVRPNLKHWYGPSNGERWDEVFIVFEGPLFELWQQNNYFDVSKPVISLLPTDFWFERIKQAIGEESAGDTEKMMFEVIRMQSLLAEIQRAGRVDLEADIVWVEQAKKSIQTSLGLEIAAEKSGLAYEAFRKKFRKLTGMAPGKYRTTVLIDHACELLSTTNLTLSDIADELGYCDEYHFSKQFRKIIGWSPREYRARVS